MSRMDAEDEFEAWLGLELRALAQSVRGSSPRAAQAAYRAGHPPRPRRRLNRAAGMGLTAGVATALALGAGAIGVAAAAGSVDPGSWGYALVRAVEGCRQPECPPAPSPVGQTPGPGGAAGAGGTAMPEPVGGAGRSPEPRRSPMPTATPTFDNSGLGDQWSEQGENSGSGQF